MPPDNATADVAPPPPAVPCLTQVAEGEIGVKETGENSGPRVNQYLASTKLGGGYFWCSSYVHWCLSQCGRTYEPAREFAAAARFGREHIIHRRGEEFSLDSANVFTLYYSKLGRIGHVGVIIGENEDYLITAEGNTSDGGSRNGDGVYKRMRAKDAVYTTNRW